MRYSTLAIIQIGSIKPGLKCVNGAVCNPQFRRQTYEDPFTFDFNRDLNDFSIM